MLAFGAAARHCAFYAGAFPIEAHKDALKSYETSRHRSPSDALPPSW
jgi:hypothetical protein